MYVFVCEYMHVNAGTFSAEEEVRSPRVGFKGGCVLPNMEAGNQTLVLCRGSAHSQPQSHPSNLMVFKRKKKANQDEMRFISMA